jgi:hypothetical protein
MLITKRLWKTDIFPEPFLQELFPVIRMKITLSHEEKD